MKGLDDDERAVLELAGTTRVETIRDAEVSRRRTEAARRLATRGLVTLVESIDTDTGLPKQTIGRTPLGGLALRVNVVDAEIR